MNGPRVSRRGFLRGASLAGLAAASPALLSACGTKSSVQTAESCVSKDLSSSQKLLNFSNWPEYIDITDDGKHMPTLEAFEKQTGIKVTYNTDINANTEFFQKVSNQLGDCQPIGRDIIVMTDWMAGRMIKLGWMQKLDHANLPNVEKNLVANLKAPTWDPHRDHSVPWQSGLTGIAYNAKYTGEVKSMEELLNRKDLKGRVSMLNELGDTMGFMVSIVGGDPTDFTMDTYDNAIDKLSSFVSNGQIRRFTGNDYIRDLKAGNIVACEAWSGDVIAMQFDDPNIKWVAPEEGLSLWSDNMMVPNKADHKANAEALMNYYYDPKVAATLAAWVNYICPVAGAQEAMATIDKSLVDNQLIFPDEAFLKKTWQFMETDEGTRATMDIKFSQAIGA
jgi:spermidine/putrescine transport system substrate-binding protein